MVLFVIASIEVYYRISAAKLAMKSEIMVLNRPKVYAVIIPN